MKPSSAANPAMATFYRLVFAAPLATILAIIRSPLTRNGYALVMSAGITSVLGLLFWVIAARLYPADQVGLGGAILAALLTLGNFAQLNLDTVLHRFLPVAGNRTSQMIAWSYVASVVMAVVVALGFIVLTPVIAPKLSFLANDIWIALIFAASCALWALFALQDAVLAGLRRSTWIPLENTIYAIAKIAALVAFAAVSLLHVPIFLAWVAPLPVIVAVVTVGIFRYLVPLNAMQGSTGSGLTRKHLVRFFGWDYVGSIAMMVTMGGAPLLVLNLTSAESMADYYLAWTITSSLYLIGRSMGISLLAEGAADEGRMKQLTADALVHTFLLLSAALLVAIIGAPLIMSLFGPRYVAEGVPLLRVLALSCLPWAMITIYLTVARANGHLIMVAGVQLATLVLTLGLGATLIYYFGTIGMGMAWLITHSLVLTGIAIHIARTTGPGSLLNWLLAIASSLSRFASTLFHRDQTGSSDGLQPGMLQPILKKSVSEDTANWSVLGKAATRSDVQTFFVGQDDVSSRVGSKAPTAHARVILKTASSEAGKVSLDHYVTQVGRLKADPRIAKCSVGLPHILHYGGDGSLSFLVENVLPGENGCDVFRHPDHAAMALASAVKTMAALHACTAQPVRIGEDWLSRWIDQPAKALSIPSTTLVSPRHRRLAIEKLISEQRNFWEDRVIPLGLGHGDYSPGNLLFKSRRVDGGAPNPMPEEKTVSAIIDWGTASEDAPPGLDPFHLLLTTRMLLTGQELGYVVSDLLYKPELSGREADWLSIALDMHHETRPWLSQPSAIRALAGLAWLQHVKSNIEKSARYQNNRLWTAWNIERVLQMFHKMSSVSRP